MSFAATADGGSLFAHYAYIKLWLARLASMVASQMLMVAVGWQIYDLTGSAWALGLVGLMQFLPALLLALRAGQVIDRHKRARIVAICLAMQVGLSALLLSASAGGWAGLEFLLASAWCWAPYARSRCRRRRR